MTILPVCLQIIELRKTMYSNIDNHFIQYSPLYLDSPGSDLPSSGTLGGEDPVRSMG